MSEIESRAREIFLKSLELQNTDDISLLIDEACGSDQKLRERVQALIDAHNQAGDFLATSMGDGTTSPSDSLDSNPATAPSSISILRQINQICIEFERAWIPESRPDFRSYLHRVGAEHRHQLMEEVLGIDLDLRLKSGQEIKSNDYHGLGDEAVAFVKKFLRSPHVIDRNIEPSDDSHTSQRIGPFKLLQKIGEGGMGTVWMADQEEPVKRRVALKVIKSGMDSKQVIARFEAERQALAMMDHQNIARVLDAGMTEGGRPYFAMELVQGIPLIEYCDENKLGINQRLEIFRQVCNAVQHAHQKGIIHRDLKSSNILVTLQDDQPVPKVIDFGLAKATNQRLTERTMFTAHGQLLGTLEYMSPEQANLNEFDVDTRSDIYSLGVILYELLTGSTPLTRESLKQAAFLEILNRIKDEEPEKPSSRISHSSDTLRSISSARQIEPRKLSSLMKAELDWVVMKAIEKDRTRRYETANSLSSDIERYLNDEVVEARGPTTCYRLAKFARKYRALVFATLTTILIIPVILSVVAVVIIIPRLDERIRKQAQRTASSIALSTESPLWNVQEKVIGDLLGASLTNEEIVYAEVTDQSPISDEWRKLAWRPKDSSPRDLAEYSDPKQYALASADVVHNGHVLGKVNLVMSRQAINAEINRYLLLAAALGLVECLVVILIFVAASLVFDRWTRTN